jgi:hypothetical protein
MTNADLLHALRDCYHPSLQRNIVELGLVQSATLILDDDAPGARIVGVPQRFIAHVALIAPGVDEAANVQLVAQIENRLLGIALISRVDVILLPPLFAIL